MGTSRLTLQSALSLDIRQFRQIMQALVLNKKFTLIAMSYIEIQENSLSINIVKYC